MKTLTLFSAIDKTRNMMDCCCDARRDRFAIAIADDRWARKWQRWHRLYAKLEQAIILRLGGVVVNSICMCCGKYRQRCTCGRWPHEA